MGRFVDLNKRLSKEDREYLKSRSRGYLIPANERRFGTEENPHEPESHELEGTRPENQYYDNEERAKAVYDTGGAPLPNTTLDYNTGRAYDRDNGVLVEPRLAGHTPGAHPSPWTGEYDEDDSDIDDDIAEEVTSLTVAELKEKLDKAKVQYSHEDKKADLQDKLAIHLQDKRDGKK
jgi:3-mercaptopyruvate sulfurtransferase SseA